MKKGVFSILSAIAGVTVLFRSVHFSCFVFFFQKIVSVSFLFNFYNVHVFSFPSHIWFFSFSLSVLSKVVVSFFCVLPTSDFREQKRSQVQTCSFAFFVSRFFPALFDTKVLFSFCTLFHLFFLSEFSCWGISVRLSVLVY